MANNAKMNDCLLMIQAGFDPKNGLPFKHEEAKFDLKIKIRQALRILDEQNAINRYKWFNLPDGIDGQLLERILYFKGQLAMFYISSINKFLVLPFALNGGIDVYGRFKGITPLPFNGTDSEDAKGVLSGLLRFPIYEISDGTEEFDAFEDGCVLLSDYSKQISQTNIPRVDIQEPILDAMSEAFPFARTNLIARSGVKGVRVNDEDQQASVESVSRAVTKAALTGKPWVPIVAPTDFQDLAEGSPMKSQEYLEYMQSLDNFRLSLYGLKNGGIFEKDSTYVNTTTAGNIQNNVGLVYQDGLTLRQKFCDIVNSIWGLGIWCESSETVLNSDKNSDGEISDTESGDNGNIQTTEGEVNENVE